MAGKGGGAWKVAYADFVTAMMAFFLVMWITAQSKPVKQAVAEYFEDPLGVNRGSRSTTLKGPEDSTTIGAFKSGRGPARGLAMADNKASGNRNPQGTAAKKPARMMIHRHLDRTRSVGTVIPFPDDSAELNDLGREQLDSVIPQLLGKLNKVEVRVYTPRRPLAAGAPFSDTWSLGFARCTTTMRYLIEHGIDAERLRLSQDGEFEPLPAQAEAIPEDLSSGVEVFAIDDYVNK